MSSKAKSPAPAVCRVIVTVSGGVADILFKPVGVEVHIIDYDVDGKDADRLDRDPDGRLCCIARWDAGKPVTGCTHWPMVRSAARQIRRQSGSRWRCPICQKTATCRQEDLAEAGTPHCADCDRAMQIV